MRGAKRSVGPGTRYSRIYEVIRHIPSGRVATYGQIARLSGIPGCARQVGYALHRLPEGSDVPWHRVVNGAGRISLDPVLSGSLQRARLEAEGVVFDEDGAIPFGQYLWPE